MHREIFFDIIFSVFDKWRKRVQQNTKQILLKKY